MCSNLCIWKHAVFASNTEYFQIPWQAGVNIKIIWVNNMWSQAAENHAEDLEDETDEEVECEVVNFQ